METTRPRCTLLLSPPTLLSVTSSASRQRDPSRFVSNVKGANLRFPMCLAIRSIGFALYTVQAAR